MLQKHAHSSTVLPGQCALSSLLKNVNSLELTKVKILTVVYFISIALKEGHRSYWHGLVLVDSKQQSTTFPGQKSNLSFAVL